MAQFQFSQTSLGN